MSASASIGFNVRCPGLASLSDGCTGCSDAASCPAAAPPQLPGCIQGFGREKKKKSHLSCAAKLAFFAFLQLFSLSGDHSPLQGCTGQSHRRNRRKDLQWPATLCKEGETDAGRVVWSKAGLWEMKVRDKGQAWIAVKLIPHISHASSMCFQFASLMYLVQFSPCSPSSASPFQWQQQVKQLSAYAQAC